MDFNAELPTATKVKIKGTQVTHDKGSVLETLTKQELVNNPACKTSSLLMKFQENKHHLTDEWQKLTNLLDLRDLQTRLS